MTEIWDKIFSADFMEFGHTRALKSKLREEDFILQVREALFQTGKLSAYHFVSWKEALPVVQHRPCRHSSVLQT
jgi:hypothetical protein